MQPSTEPVSRKRGNALGILIFQTLLRLFGLRVAYSLLYLVCLYYLIFDRAAVNGAMAYIKRRFPECSRLQWYGRVYLLFISQGQRLIDRYAAISGAVEFETKLEGGEELLELLKNRKEGFVLLTAHVGNWQTAVMALKNMERPVYLLMRPEDNPVVQKMLGIGKEGDFLKILSSDDGPESIVRIMNAIQEGGVVSIMGDRKYAFEAGESEFLNDTACFPYGPFSIAAGLNCPIVVLLSANTGYRKYMVDVSNVIHPRYESPKNKREQLKKFIRQFAEVLENYTGTYPYQFFLFHDIWKKSS